MADESAVTSLETVAERVKKEMDSFETSRGRGQKFRVTDLINPIQAHFDIKNPNLKDPSELQFLFNYGNFIESRVERILRTDPGFVVEQGQVNGSSCGMENVRGRIDFRLSNMIVEFKTSDYDIDTEEALYDKNPQDLDQLILYALFTNRESSNHRLLYLCGRSPNTVARSFLVKIKNRDSVIEYYQKRLSGLESAISVNSPNGLGRCRYFDSTCKFKIGHVCNCENEAPIDIGTIKQSVHVKILEDDLTGKLANFSSNRDSPIGIWDLLTPRKWFIETGDPFQFQEQEDENSWDNYRLRRQIERALLRERAIKQINLQDKSSSLKGPFFKVNVGGKDFPIIVRVIDTALGRSNKGLNSYYKAQLGLYCSLADSLEGYVFIFYKNPGNGVLFKLHFSKLGNILNGALEMIKSMNKAMTSGEHKKLPLCPEFVQSKACYAVCLCRGTVKA